mmetsp:Transcript_9287/g.27687  ORF Transcript_9287/g.27687 Transcript_9287/m.27687 type:complete len:235 (-) Transcript_9287:1818-2522(-)
MAAILQEVMGIQGNNTCLIRLCDVSKDAINHANQHAVFQRVSGILYNWNNVGSQLGNAQKIASGTMRELYGIHGSILSDNIRNVGDRSSSCSTNVKDFRAGFDPNIVNTAQNSSGDLRSEGIPYTVFCFHSGTTWFCRWCFNADSLFAIYSNTRRGVQCDQGIFLTTGYENTLVAMRFDDDPGATLHSSSASSSASSTSSACASSTSSNCASSSSSSPRSPSFTAGANPIDRSW